jgi:hypothetical protein
MLTPACYPSLGKYDAVARTDCRFQLTGDQWFLIQYLFEWQGPNRIGGRPRVPPRMILKALLWLLRNGGRWQEATEAAERLARMKAEGGSVNWAPSESTCRRRL